MKQLNIILLSVFFTCLAYFNTTEATRPFDKRLAPENVAIIDNDIKYIPNSYYDPKRGRTFYIEAWNVLTGEKLWQQKIYEIKYNLKLEQDVQDKFITSLSIKGGKLIVVNEAGDIYELNLKTRKVIKKGKGIPNLCEEMYNEIENDFAKANFCEKDSDCKAVALGGWYIDFGCYKFINKTINENELYTKIRKYKDDMQCSRIIDECASSPIPVCVNKKCVVNPKEIK